MAEVVYSENRICSKCGRNWTHAQLRTRRDRTTYLQALWHSDHNGGYWCQNCYSLHISTKKHNPDLLERKIRYKGQQIFLPKGHKPRIGVCNFCRAIKGQIDTQIDKVCTNTAMAHMAYHDDDPLKDSIELCNRCHTIYDKGYNPFNLRFETQRNDTVKTRLVVPLEERECIVCKCNSEYIKRKYGKIIWYRGNTEYEYICASCYYYWKKSKL